MISGGGGNDQPPDRWTTGAALAMHAARQSDLVAALEEMAPPGDTFLTMLGDAEVTSAQQCRDVVSALVVLDHDALPRAASLLGEMTRALSASGELAGHAAERRPGYDATARLLASVLAIDRMIEATARRRAEGRE